MFSDSLLVHFGNLNFDAVVSWMPWVSWAYPAGLELLPARFDLRRTGVEPWQLLLAVVSLGGVYPGRPSSSPAFVSNMLTWLYSDREAPQPARRAAAARAIRP